MIRFNDVYEMLVKKGPGKTISSKGTHYTIEAQPLTKGDRKGEKAIIAKPLNGGSFRIHNDCWGKNITCQGSRTGGVYNGSYSIYDWYNEQL